MTKQFENKVALVTGAGSGIGRATALAFGRAGAKVVVSDVAVDGAEETVRLIKEAGSEAMFARADVAQAAEVEALIQQTVKRYGRLDFAFNNAGIEGATATTHEYGEQDWDRVININLKGVWLCMKYQLPVMVQGGGGAIVNTASIAGLVGSPALSAYTASKHGVVGLTKTAALEYGKQGIRVNAVCPGVIFTAMVERALGSRKAVDARQADATPLARAGEPNEVAAAVVWLCSDGASFVTGHTLTVDGGFVAQ